MKSKKNLDREIISKHKLYVEKSMFHLCRSITGKGIKKSLFLIQKKFKKLKIHKIRSGTKVFDWKIPSEWNIKKAHVIDKNNKKIIDFKKSNLHIVNYSKPIKTFLKRDDLLKKIYSLPKQLDAIPYVTSYYRKNWGFCCTHKTKKKY